MIVFKKFKKSKNLKQLNSLHQYSLTESKLEKTDNWVLQLIILYWRGNWSCTHEQYPFVTNKPSRGS